MSIEEFNLYLIEQQNLGNYLIIYRGNGAEVLYDEDILSLVKYFSFIENIIEEQGKIVITLIGGNKITLKEF